uniref:Uncharacterized protein n=1 Tax=Noctiluca scintillans TaxID=2966 RepID=A0A7S1A5E7_NOCSC
MADYILLFVVGLLHFFFELDLLIKKYTVRFHGIDPHGNAAFDVARSFFSIYIMCNIIGFLVTTLENSVAPRNGREREFLVLMALLVLLWSNDFFVVMLERGVFSSPSIGHHLKNIATLKVTAAASQIFITHSTAMLGAIMLGHSCHFKKSPDLTWHTVRKMCACLLLLSVFICWFTTFRRVHTWEYCFPETFKVFALTYPTFVVIFRAVGGLVLLIMSLTREKNKHGGDSDDETASARGSAARHEAALQALKKILDYDSVLIMLTFSGAIFWDVTNILGIVASERAYFNQRTIPPIVALLGPLGLAAFALSVWRTPPVSGTAAFRGLWFGMFFAGVMFLEFQQQEDCEISADLPECCEYPTSMDLFSRTPSPQCHKNLRCLFNGTVFTRRGEESMYCALDEGSHGRRLTVPSPEYFTSAACSELNARWERYVLEGGADQEVMHETQHTSTAYRTLKSLGAALSVEMYFTIFGILLKVMVLTHHPHSEHILQLETHHTHVGRGGKRTVVAMPHSRRRMALSIATTRRSVVLEALRKMNTRSTFTVSAPPRDFREG